MNEDIFHKGYKLYIYIPRGKDEKFKAKVLGRDSAKFTAYGSTKKEAINTLKKQIDKYR